VLIVFMWRACHSALVTKANLSKRKITEDLLCSLCEAEAETTGHVLWGCQLQRPYGVCVVVISKKVVLCMMTLCIVEELY
jgi:hypothetical protein